MRGLLDERRAIETEGSVVALPPSIYPVADHDTNAPGRLLRKRNLPAALEHRHIAPSVGR